MTWIKLGSEFFDTLAAQGLSDAATRTHVEAIGWLYVVEDTTMRIPKHLVRRFAGSPEWERGITELLTTRLWIEHGDSYEVVHHASVVRQSLAAQAAKRNRDNRAQRTKRAGEAARDGTGVPVAGDVSADTDRQTDSLDKEAGSARPCALCGRRSTFLDGGLCRREECRQEAHRRATPGRREHLRPA